MICSFLLFFKLVSKLEMRHIFFSEAMLGCTQEEIGRAGLCDVCING